jgi:hypothetical protein
MECEKFAHDICERAVKNKLNLVGVWKFRWVRGDTKPAGEYTFFCGEWNENHELGIGFLCIRES